MLSAGKANVCEVYANAMYEEFKSYCHTFQCIAKKY